MASLSTSYVYQTLPGAMSTRLLILHSAENLTDPLKCSLEIVELTDEKDQYDALSYTWGMDSDGSAGQTCSMTLDDDTSLSITQNLSDGLRRIRLSNDLIRIWVDAVCINQNDNSEKSIQVAMMADIYAGARSVHIWLGEGGDASEDKIFLDVLKRIEERAATVRPWKDHSYIHQNCFVLPLLSKGGGVSQCPGCVAEQVEAKEEHAAHVDWMSKWFASDLTEGHNAARMTNLAIKFFSRRYWKRRWILQELCFAKNQLLYWGGCFMDVSGFPKDWLEDFRQAIWVIVHALRSAQEILSTTSNIEHHRAFDIAPLNGGTPIMSRLKGLSQYCTPQKTSGRQTESVLPSWNWCLKEFHSSECSDARDMYYALAGMIEPRIRVDYSLTQTEVFIAFAEAMLRMGEWVWVFYCAAKRSDNTGQDIQDSNALPTWVPDPRLVDFHYGGDDPPMGIQILTQEKALLCDVRCLGILHKKSVFGFELQWNRIFWQICDSNGVASTGSIQPAPLQPHRLREHYICSGDIVCSCQEKFSDSDVWLILRPAGPVSKMYKLVGVTRSESAYSRRANEDGEDARSFRRCPKIQVRII